MVLETVLPIQPAIAAILLLMTSMIGTYITAGSISVMTVVVLRRCGQEIAPCLLDPEVRAGMAMVFQPRLFAAVLASILAAVPESPVSIVFVLGCYVGAVSSQADVADWLLRTARRSEGGV